MNIAFPFRFDSRGRTALDSDESHILGMIKQLLFTRPGERPNRPDFGSGLMQLIFAPNSFELAATVQFSVQAALQRYLGDLIEVRGVQVTCNDSTLNVTLIYIIRSSNTPVETNLTQAIA
jgi:uncharacterized protein